MIGQTDRQIIWVWGLLNTVSLNLMAVRWKAEVGEGSDQALPTK